MAFNGWEHHDLNVQLRDSNISNSLELYKKKHNELRQECSKIIDLKPESEEYKKQHEKCTFMHEQKMKIALHIADTMTGI